MKNTYKFNSLLSGIVLGLIFFTLILFKFFASVWQALLGVLAIPLLFAIIKNPFWGLCLMVTLIPTEEATLIGSSWSVPKLLGFLTFGVFLLNLLVYKRKIYWAKQFPILFAFIFFLSISPLWAFYKGGFQLDAIKNLLMMGAFCLLIPQLIDSPKKLKTILLLYILGAFAAAAVGVFNLFKVPEAYRVSVVMSKEIRYAGSSAPTYAYLLGLGILTFTTRLILPLRRKWGKIFLFILLLFLLYAALASGTRSFLYALLLAWLFIFIYLALISRKYKLTLLIYPLALIAIFLLILNFLPERTKTRYAMESLSEGIFGYGGGRIHYWKMGLIEFIEHPILGLGLGNSYLEASSAYIIALYKYGTSLGGHLSPWEGSGVSLPLYIRDIHNVYIEILAEGGIVGFMIFIWLIYSLLGVLFKNLRRVYENPEMFQLGLAIASMFVFVLVGGLSEPSLNRKYFWLVPGLIMAFARIINQSDKKAKEFYDNQALLH
jgi:O-antigen ligase